MKYAHQLSDMINAFSPAPLKIDQMEQFYCNGTMEYRMGDRFFHLLKIFLKAVWVWRGLRHICCWDTEAVERAQS